MTTVARCKPHRWDVEKWAPIFKGADIETKHMTCLNCGRMLRPMDTSPNMRARIANSIASRMFDGDEFDEVYESVNKYFQHHIAAVHGWRIK